MRTNKFIIILCLLVLATATDAKSIENIANISFNKDNRIYHLEFSVTNKGIMTHGNDGKNFKIQEEKFGSQPQLSDGRILLRPKSDENTHIWDYNASRPGKYWMEIVYSLAKGESIASPNVSSYRITTKLKATGAINRFRNVNLGKVYFTSAGKQRIELKFKEGNPKVRAVILRPASEGETIIQSIDRSILLHSRDATIHGVKVQYENKPHKNTIGFWVNTSDQVYWDFNVESGGKFNIEVHQGCGRGHGGSQVIFVVDEQKTEFIVEDTGHFQNFVPRNAGSIHLTKGKHRFWIKPIKKERGAIMDVRLIRLIPTD